MNAVVEENLFNFIENDTYSGEKIEVGLSVSPNRNVTDALARKIKFDNPPKMVQEEVNMDSIVDDWEQSASCQDIQEQINRDFESELSKECARENYQPIIGILTQPVADIKKDHFNYNDYILEINDNFVKWAGSRTVAIPYDISEENLMHLLPQINGILFTGGALELINQTTGKQHKYYVTAKKIFQYSKFMKDVKEEEWPILGICQGLEVISVLLNDDKIQTLDEINIYGQSLPIDWSVKNVT